MRKCIMCIFFLSLSVLGGAQQGTPTAPISGRTGKAQSIRLPGNTHPWANSKFATGRVSADHQMERMLLVLKRSPEKEAELERYLASLHDKNSPNYHQWLTPHEFGVRFGAAEEDINKVTDWLRSQGLSPRHISEGQNFIEFSGSTGSVEQTFHTEMRTYKIGAQTYYANAKDPEIPEMLTSTVAGVATLHSFPTRSSTKIIGSGSGLYRDGALRPSFTFYSPQNTPQHALVPDDLQTIYNAKPLLSASAKISGAGQKIAVVARSNINEADFRAFRALFYPFARQDVLKIIINGVDPGPTYDDDMIEATADVEYAGAMAPDADIYLIVTASTTDSDGIALSALYAVENNIAPVLSVSYGACEAAMGATYNEFFSSLWQQAAAQGITVAVSTGDSGPAGCEQPFASGNPAIPTVSSSGRGVNGLASTQYNVAVGGTRFNESTSTEYWSERLNVAFGSALSYIPEIAWNESCAPEECGAADSNFTASSGGPSSCTASALAADGSRICNAHYPKPSWQSGIGVPIDAARDVPDISLTAAAHDGYVLCFQGSCTVDAATGNFGFYLVGGTSLATPTFASAMALVNQKTGELQGQAAPELYHIASIENAQAFHCNASLNAPAIERCSILDITKGNSDIPCLGGTPECSSTTPDSYGVLKGYDATAGYDLVTGIGSVNVANLVNNWETGPRRPVQVSLRLSPDVSKHGDTVTAFINVSPESEEGIPSGDVVLMTDSALSNERTIFLGNLINGSLATRLKSLPGGNHHITARYSGDAEFLSNTSSEIPVSVISESSTTTLELLAQTENGFVPIGTTVPYGSRIISKTRVNGESGVGIPTGTVTLLGSLTTQEPPSSQMSVLNNAGTSEIPLVAMHLGSYVLKAAYSGDDSFKPSTSNTSTFVVVKDKPFIAVSSMADTITNDEILQLHIVIKTTSVSGICPSGTVTLLNGETRIQSAIVYGYVDITTGYGYASADLNIPGRALGLGPNTLHISYDGDELYEQVESTEPVMVKVTSAIQEHEIPANITLSLTSGNNNIVVLQADVKDDHSLPVTGGTVSFFNRRRLLGKAQVVGHYPAPGFNPGSATLKLRLPAGNNTLTARFEGVGNKYQSAVSIPVSCFVSGIIETKSVLTANENPRNPSDYDLTMTVLGNSVSPPSGTAILSDLGAGAELGRLELSPSKLGLAIDSISHISITQGDSAGALVLNVADLNLDGLLDVILADDKESRIMVLLGNGNGTFGLPQEFEITSGPTQAIICDVNQDGYPDVMIASAAGEIQILLGKGDGTFIISNHLKVIEESLIGIVEDDFNADGIPDIAAYSDILPYVFVFLGRGDGTFLTAKTYLSREIVTGLASIDLNRDGIPDLITSGFTGLNVLMGCNDGSFLLSENRPLENGDNYFLSVSHPVISDFNNDGVSDIAVVPDLLPFQVMVLLGNADGGFSPPHVLSPNEPTNASRTISSSTLMLEDFNADGVPDILQMLSSNSTIQVFGTIYVYLGNGDGSFEAPAELTLPEWGTHAPTAFALGDLNGDGVQDVLTTIPTESAITLTTSLVNATSSATLTDVFPATPPQIIQGHFVPSTGSMHAASSSNTLSLGSRLPTISILRYGYKNTQGNCVLGDESVTVYWNSVPCFYLRVSSSTSELALTGTVTLVGTTPGGIRFRAGPYSLYPDGNGGYLYIFYEYGLGDAGEYVFTMSYSGDQVHQSSTSDTVILPIQSLPTRTTLFGPAIISSGKNAAFSGRVESPILPGVDLSGQVQLYDENTFLTKTNTDASGQYIALLLLPVGTHSIWAKFEGSSGQYNLLNAAPSTADPLIVTVVNWDSQPITNIELTVSPDPPTAEKAVSLAAHVSNGNRQIHGTVTFMDGASPLGTATLVTKDIVSSTGTATLNTGLGPGRHVLSAHYNGFTRVEPNPEIVLPVTSLPHEIFVTGIAETVIHLTATSDGERNSFIADVFAYGPMFPSGTVHFHDITSNTDLGTVILEDTQRDTPSFSQQQTISFQGDARDLAVMDINKDGIPDLILADSITNTIHVLMAQSKGIYDKDSNYTVSGIPTVLSYSANAEDDTFTLFVGTENRTIDRISITSNGILETTRILQIDFVPDRILSGDLNGDGLLDLVVFSKAENAMMSVLIGDANGSFTSVKSYSLPKTADRYSAILADVTNDQIPDVLFTTSYGATYEMLGVGDGTLQPTIYVGPLNGAIVASDFNADGNVDLAFNTSPGTIGVQLGRGDGTYIPPRYYSADLLEILPENITLSTEISGNIGVADLNGDGIPDLIASKIVLLGLGDGTFQLGQFTGKFSAIKDINLDGIPDLLTLSNNEVMLQSGGSTAIAKLVDIPLPGKGVHQIEASFEPCTGNLYRSSTSQVIQIESPQGKRSRLSLVTLPASSNDPIYGDPVIIEAKVSSEDLTAQPQGSVHFSIDGEFQKTSQLHGDVAQIVFTTLTGGPHLIEAIYDGDNLFSPSNESLALNIQPASAKIRLNVSQSLPDSMVLEAKVQGKTGLQNPSGVIDFRDNTLIISSVPLNNGVAYFSTANLDAGMHEFAADYLGDRNYQAASSTSLKMSVSAPDFVASITPSAIDIRPKGSAISVLSVIAVGGFSGTIELKCSDLPPEISCIFRPTTLEIDQTHPLARTRLTIDAKEQISSSQHNTYANGLVFLFISMLLVNGSRFNVARSFRITGIHGKFYRISAVGIMLLTLLSCGNRVANDAYTIRSTYYIPISISNGGISHTLVLKIFLR